jgi:rhodanese-related sulfurtransferase
MRVLVPMLMIVPLVLFAQGVDGSSGQRQPRVQYHFPGEEDTLEFRYGFTVEDVAELIRTDTALVIVDIRPSASFAKGHLRGSINIPRQQLLDRLSQLQQWERLRRNILLVSSDGKDAKRMAAQLHRRNVTRVWYLRGGIAAWVSAGRRLATE